MHKKKTKLIGKMPPFIVFISILLFWELFIRIFNIPEYLLPAPSVIFIEILTNLKSLMYHTSITIYEAVMGFLIANILALLVSIIFIHSKAIEDGFYPYIIGLRVSPIIAIAPLLILWFGSGLSSKIICSALLCFFPTLVNLTKGLRAIEYQTLELFRSFSASKITTLIKLRLPNSLPYLFSALKINVGLSIAGAIIGEFVGSTKGIGYLILISSYRIETTKVFAGLFIITIVGVCMFYLISYIEKKVVFWYEE